MLPHKKAIHIPIQVNSTPLMLKQPHLMNTALRDDFSNHQNCDKITALIWSTYKLLPTASAIKLGWSLFNNLKYVSSYGMNGDYWQCDLWLLYKAMNFVHP